MLLRVLAGLLAVGGVALAGGFDLGLGEEARGAGGECQEVLAAEGLEALSRSDGSLLISPKEFGPTTRIPAPRARRSSSAWRRAPSRPSSANPPETTSSALTPASAHSSTTSSTAWAGTAMTARSTRPGTAATEG